MPPSTGGLKILRTTTKKGNTEMAKQKTRDQLIIELARDKHEGDGDDGDIEFDDNAIVSEGEDNGAYVQAWVWVSFTETRFDKEK